MFWAAGGLKKVDNTDVVGIKRSGDIDMHLKDMGNKQSVGKEKDVGSHLRASSTALSWSYTSLACLLAFVVICRIVIYLFTYHLIMVSVFGN